MAEIHVGDVGTRWLVRCLDGSEPFDPSEATTKEIIFKMPQGAIAKPATAVQIGADWFLEYIAEPGFQSTTGKVSLQGHVVMPDGKVFRSNVQTLDEDGAELRIHKNIEVA